MGFVYFGAGRDPGRIVIASANDVSVCTLHHQQSDPEYRLYRSLQTTRHLACERYLHSLYAGRRLMQPAQEPWFALEFDEVDHAIHLWQCREERYGETVQAVTDLKREPSSGRHLPVTSADRKLCDRLQQVREELAALSFEQEFLENELKLRIGANASLSGLASWESKQALRFNATSFKSVHPELYEQFREPTTTRFFRLL